MEMSDIPANGSKPEQAGPSQAERLVYVMSERALETADEDISLRELWDIAWRGKWLIIAVTALFALAAVGYALQATEWYRAEVLLVPAEERSTPSLGGLGGLAALAGVSIGGSGGAEAIAVAKSREFARAFIADFQLLPVLFPEEWDVQNGRWRGDDPGKWPDMRDAVKFFHQDVLRVSDDANTGLVTLAIEWTDPELASEWASELVRRLNAKVRERALLEAETNVAYLQAELAQTNVITLQQSIGRLLENELQKLMLARGNEEFAYRVIDSAYPPKERVRPRRALIAILGTIVGGMLGVFAVFAWHAVRTSPREMENTQ